MQLVSAAQQYKALGDEIRRLTEERKELKELIIDEMGDMDSVVVDGVKVTKFTKAIRDLPIEVFEDILQSQGVNTLYHICRVVQSRLTPELKSELVEVGRTAEEIRVTV